MLCEIDRCIGCAACSNICPVSAIEMKQDSRGFYKAHIEEKCIECGKCTKVCPVLNSFKREERIIPEAYIVKNSVSSEVKRSASGGVFSTLANWIIAQKGCVYGAVWNEQHHVEIRRADTVKECMAMHGSKYVYSHMDIVYKDMEEQLAKGKKVLMTGLPCQIMGLRGYLGKEYENLFLVEIVCHGAGSERVFDDYITYIQEKNNKKLRSLNQSSKKRPWTKLIRKYISQEWEDGSMTYYDYLDDSYMSFYMSNVCLNDGCHYCPAARIPRTADITVGDFYGVGVLKKHKINCTDGVSFLWCNTKKGKDLFDNIEKEGNTLCERCELEENMIFNHNLWKPSDESKGKSRFWELYNKNSYSEMVNIYFERNKKYKINNAVKFVLLNICSPNIIVWVKYLLDERKYGYTKVVKEKISELKKEIENEEKSACSSGRTI